MNQREIAKLAGVSSATVSRVINHDPSVSPETAARVNEVIAKHGYVQNVIARSLKMANTKTIGFLVPDISNPFFPAVLSGIEAVCAKYRYNMIIQNTSEDRLREEAALETLLKQRVDGLLAILVTRDSEQLAKFQAMNIPVVLIDRLTTGGEYDSVTIDNAGGVAQGIEYLKRLGHARIAIIHVPTDISLGEERLNGYRLAMQEAGLEVLEEYIVNGNAIEEGGYLGAQELMRLPAPPTAIFAANNLMTMGAYKALADARMAIPKDVSLLGFDDFSLAGYLSPPITLINRPTSEMGRSAAEMLFERLTGNSERPVRQVVLPTALQIRSSCAQPKHSPSM
ncbi:LacI family transcriptional regulator [Hydrogenispora ethanolica]|uniref:LacI family transcriptional regulator n=1 Tax=Hydrogenispora ethanolica TaxID=1082276 RepID=A0A4R1RAJ6_HYDET|nr:LacI family DNA-binding transcriptional regulator [Hydrogenispora ethanolica]TCL62755.1 LacI family transcriptional regulator [Hydrogenispora ethanolica]